LGRSTDNIEGQILRIRNDLVRGAILERAVRVTPREQNVLPGGDKAVLRVDGDLYDVTTICARLVERRI